MDHREFPRSALLRSTRYAVIAAAILALPGVGGSQTTQPATTPTAPATVPATAPATLPIDPVILAKVTSLIDGLANPDWKTRKKSTADLERLGETAEPALQQALARLDLAPDARTAIEVLLRQAVERRRTGPTLVTLDLTQIEPAEAVSVILKQGGFTLTPDALDLLKKKSDQKLDLKLDREPLWSALLKTTVSLDLGFTGLTDAQVSLVPLEAELPASPAAADGPFMLTLQRIEVTIRKVKEFAGQRGPNAGANAIFAPPLRISVAAWAEPRIKPGVWVLESMPACTTDNGKTLTAQIYSYTRNNKPNDGTGTYLTLNGDTAGAKSIAAMTLKARFLLQWTTETLEIDNVNGANEVSKTVAGNRVVLKNFKKAMADTWTYEIILYRDNRSQEEWTAIQQTIDRTGCRVTDAEGKALQQRGSGSSWSTNEIRVSGTVTQVAGIGEPQKLKWDLPGKIESLPGTFEFKNIPLP